MRNDYNPDDAAAQLQIVSHDAAAQLQIASRQQDAWRDFLRRSEGSWWDQESWKCALKNWMRRKP